MVSFCERCECLNDVVSWSLNEGYQRCCCNNDDEKCQRPREKNEQLDDTRLVFLLLVGRSVRWFQSCMFSHVSQGLILFSFLDVSM
jgi:hypothetical protein